jgi:hypothetical protein
VSLFRTLARMFIGDPGDPMMLDHVPTDALDCRTPEKVAEARRKLGRPFAPEVRVSRLTPPSHTLEHIKNQAEQARKVTNIDTRRKSK